MAVAAIDHVSQRVHLVLAGVVCNQGKHGRNTYEPEDFGLDKRQINSHFAEYIKTYLYQ